MTTKTWIVLSIWSILFYLCFRHKIPYLAHKWNCLFSVRETVKVFSVVLCCLFGFALGIMAHRAGRVQPMKLLQRQEPEEPIGIIQKVKPHIMEPEGTIQKVVPKKDEPSGAMQVIKPMSAGFDREPELLPYPKNSRPITRK